mgnify:CR=1 FL=1
MGRKVNWGIIAAGGIARRRTLPAMKDVPNAVITGIMDKNQKVLDEISEEYKITDTYTEEQELLNNPQIEAVYVASQYVFTRNRLWRYCMREKAFFLKNHLQ